MRAINDAKIVAFNYNLHCYIPSLFEKKRKHNLSVGNRWRGASQPGNFFTVYGYKGGTNELFCHVCNRSLYIEVEVAEETNSQCDQSPVSGLIAQDSAKPRMFFQALLYINAMIIYVFISFSAVQILLMVLFHMKL